MQQRKEIPILFSTPMVQAILDGRKTETRRVVKGGFDVSKMVHTKCLYNENPKVGYQAFFREEHDNDNWWGISSKWQPGDLLWVRESWRVNTWWADDGELLISFNTEDNASIRCNELDIDMFNRLWEQSCNDLDKAGYVLTSDNKDYKDYDVTKLRLRPSIHMPKAAARIWLEVTEVKCERLQDITEESARAEGVRYDEEVATSEDVLCDGYYFYPCNDFRDDSWGFSAKTSFYSLWCSINGVKSWPSNPWVWVVKFKVLSTTGRPAEF